MGGGPMGVRFELQFTQTGLQLLGNCLQKWRFRLNWNCRQCVQFLKLLVVLVLSAGSPFVRATDSQAADADATCPGLKIAIAVPDDVVRPQMSVFLEMTLTNVGQAAIWLPSGSPDFLPDDYEVRDAQGTLVPRTAEWMHFLSQRPTWTTANVSVPLDAGASLTKNLMLEQLFDLSKPGEYTIRVSLPLSVCGNTGTHLTSNTVHFTVGERSVGPSNSRGGISVRVTAAEASLPAGWGVPLDIVVQNKSDRPLRWAVDDPPNMAPDEFLTGVEVLNSSGEICPSTKQLDPNWGFSRYWGLSRFRGSVSILEIPPGKSAEQMIVVGDVFDIGKPGRYQAKVAVLDPVSNRRIESNLVSFEIADTASEPLLPKQPPFLVTLRKGHFSPDPSGVLICMSNISDHDIRMDNSSAKDFVSVEDLDGKAATLTQAAQKARQMVDLTQATANSVQCCTWDTVKPRKALCGGLTVGAIYDLSKAGQYRIRVDRYDEPDATQGQKLGDLPMVHSNWLTILEHPLPPSKE